MLKSAVQQRSTCGWVVSRSSRPRCRSVATTASATSQELRTTVLFQVSRRVAFGNSLAILGSRQSLGNWQPADALAMTWAAGDEWSVSADLPAGVETEFKYIVRSQAGVISEWQPGPNSSVIPPLEASEVLVSELWESSANPTLTILTARPTSEASQHTAPLEPLSYLVLEHPHHDQLSDEDLQAEFELQQSLQASLQAEIDQQIMQASMQAEAEVKQEHQQIMQASAQAAQQQPGSDSEGEKSSDDESGAIWFSASSLKTDVPHAGYSASTASMDEYDGSWQQRRSTGADPMGHSDSWTLQAAAAAAAAAANSASGKVAAALGFAWEKAKKIKKSPAKRKSKVVAPAASAAQSWGEETAVAVVVGAESSPAVPAQSLQDITISEMKVQVKRRGLSSLGDRREIVQRLMDAGVE